MNLEKLKKFQHWNLTNTSASLSFRSEPMMGKTMSLLRSIGKFWTSKKEQLLCQYHEWPHIWENKKSPTVQTERVKEKRKQAKRFDSFNQWWIEYSPRTWNPEALLNTLWLNSTMHLGSEAAKNIETCAGAMYSWRKQLTARNYLEFNERQTK